MQLACSFFHLLTGRSLPDTQSGLRGISAAFMARLLKIPGEHFEFESAMLLEAARCAVPYQEIRIATVYKNSNSGTHFRPVRDSWLICKAMFRNVFRTGR